MMATPKQHHRFEAKAADTRISRNEPGVARMIFSLANGEFLVVEVSRYVLGTPPRPSKASMKQQHYSPEAFTAIRFISRNK